MNRFYSDIVKVTKALRWAQMKPVCLVVAIILCSSRSLISQDKPLPAEQISGVVVGMDGKPAANIEVALWSRVRDSKFYKTPMKVLTNAEGRFTLKDFGLRWWLRLEAVSKDGRALASMKVPNNPASEPLTLKLQQARRLDFLVLDGDQKPIADVHVGVVDRHTEFLSGATDKDGKLQATVSPDRDIRFIYAQKPGAGIDYHSYVLPVERRGDKKAKRPPVPDVVRFQLGDVRPLKVQVIDDIGAAVPNVPVYPWLLKKKEEPEDINMSFIVDRVTVVTDENGFANFDWLPAWDERKIMTFFARTRDYAGERLDFEPAKGKPPVIQLQRLTQIGGVATKPDGSPAAGVNLEFSGEDYSFGGFEASTFTDKEGRYKVRLAPNQIYLATGRTAKLVAVPQSGFAVEPGKPRTDIHFKLIEPVRVTGRVSIGKKRNGVPNISIQVYQYGMSANEAAFKIPNPTKSRSSVQPVKVHNTSTSQDGTFAFSLGPGKYDIRGPKGSVSSDFEITNDRQGHEFDFHTMRPARGLLKGFVTTDKPLKPVANVTVTGVYQHPSANYREMRAVTAGTGRFEVERGLHRMTLHAINKEKTLGGVIQIGPDDSSTRIPVQPLAQAIGRLVDRDGRPLADQKIRFGINIRATNEEGSPWSTRFGGSATTDADGRFKVDRLVQGQQYHLSVSTGRYSSTPIATIRPTRGETFDLGNVRSVGAVSRSAKVRRKTDSRDTAQTRVERALVESEAERVTTLVVFADPESSEAFSFSAARNAAVRQLESRLNKVWLPTTGPNADEAAALAKDLNVSLGGPLTLVLIDSTGKAKAVMSTAELFDGNELNIGTLSAFIAANTAEPPNAKQLLETALLKAGQDGKKVLVLHQRRDQSSRLVSRWLERHQQTIEKDFVWLSLDKSWPGGAEALLELRGDTGIRAPWLGVVDAERQLEKSLSDIPGKRDSRLYRMANIYEAFLKSVARNIDQLDIDIMVDDLKNP